jgi:hypothetical protein
MDAWMEPRIRGSVLTNGATTNTNLFWFVVEDRELVEVGGKKMSTIRHSLTHLSGRCRAIDKGCAQGLQTSEVVGMNMTEKAGQRCLVAGLVSEVVDSDLGEFYALCSEHVTEAHGNRAG